MIMLLTYSSFLTGLGGFLFMAFVGMGGFGILDQRVLSKGRPILPHPRLTRTAWGLLGAGFLLLMLSMTQGASLAAQRAAKEAHDRQTGTLVEEPR
jgi:hypothetical protein